MLLYIYIAITSSLQKGALRFPPSCNVAAHAGLFFFFSFLCMPSICLFLFSSSSFPSMHLLRSNENKFKKKSREKEGFTTAQQQKKKESCMVETELVSGTPFTLSQTSALLGNNSSNIPDLRNHPSLHNGTHSWDHLSLSVCVQGGGAQRAVPPLFTIPPAHGRRPRSGTWRLCAGGAGADAPGQAAHTNFAGSAPVGDRRGPAAD